MTCFRPADSPAIIQEHKVVATGVRCAKCRNRRVLTALREKCDEDADWLRRLRSSVALLQRNLLSPSAYITPTYAPMRVKEHLAGENSIVHTARRRQRNCMVNAIRAHSRKDGWRRFAG